MEVPTLASPTGEGGMRTPPTPTNGANDLSAGKVSIVIPTFNRAGMLSKAIETALSQSYPCEVIVCDHGSTDATPSVVREYGAAVRYIRRDLDSGPFFCWLDGALSATGEFLHFTFDDDWISENFVEKCVDLMAPDVGVVLTKAEVIFKSAANRTIPSDGVWKHLGTGLHKSSILESILLKNKLTISPGCALFRRDIVVDAMWSHPFRPRTTYRGVGPDLCMFLFALSSCERFGFVSEPHAFFRAHEGSITIRAKEGSDSQQRLEDAYSGYKNFYIEQRLAQRFRLLAFWTWLYRFWAVRGRPSISLRKP